MGIFDRFKADRTTQEELTAKEWYDKGKAVKSSKETIRCLDKALAIDPRYANAWALKGGALVNLGRHQEAIQCYDKALAIDPTNAGTWFLKGITLGMLGRFQEELPCIDKALAIDPTNAALQQLKRIISE
jgi:tetratricopeptide (TPR) repeat protein